MPDLFAHQQFGNRVLERMPAYVNLDKEVFIWAQEGPDIWSYWKPWKRNKRSWTVHNEKSEQFVEFLLNNYPDNKAVVSYALGFLCHIIYDEYAHPFIDDSAFCINNLWKDCDHIALERAIDIRMMSQYGKTPRCLLVNWPKKGIKLVESAINQAYETIYGWNKCSLSIRSAYRTRFILYLMFWDPLGILYTLGRLFGIDKLKSLSYYGKTSLPDVAYSESSINWDELSKSFDNITGNAIGKAADMIVNHYAISVKVNQ